MREKPSMRHVAHQMTKLILRHKDACKSRLVLNLSQAKRIECAVRAVIKLYCTSVSCVCGARVVLDLKATVPMSQSSGAIKTERQNTIRRRPLAPTMSPRGKKKIWPSLRVYQVSVRTQLTLFPRTSKQHGVEKLDCGNIA